MVAGVWQVLNRVTGDCLLGGSVDTTQEIKAITKVLSSESRPTWIGSYFKLDSPLSIDWRNYGENNFTLRTLEETPRKRSIISSRKLFWARTLQPKYDHYKYDPIVSGVYQIINVKTGHSYIGQSKDIFNRWMQHRSQLRCNTHYNQLLQNSFNSWGEHNLELRILEVCMPTKKMLQLSEKDWIKSSQDLFNVQYSA